MVGKAQKLHGARSELNSVFSLEKVDRWNVTRTSAIQSRSRPMRFLGFSNHEKGAPRQEISKRSTVCSTFFEKWVERCKKCIVCQERYFEKETVTAPPQNSGFGVIR
jgi:mevalonate pyrophosphate decarboxylase